LKKNEKTVSPISDKSASFLPSFVGSSLCEEREDRKKERTKEMFPHFAF